MSCSRDKLYTCNILSPSENPGSWKRCDLDIKWLSIPYLAGRTPVVNRVKEKKIRINNLKSFLPVGCTNDYNNICKKKKHTHTNFVPLFGIRYFKTPETLKASIALFSRENMAAVLTDYKKMFM